jgi:hypothetical protein
MSQITRYICTYIWVNSRNNSPDGHEHWYQTQDCENTKDDENRTHEISRERYIYIYQIQNIILYCSID